jgi:hypothetical protein
VQVCAQDCENSHRLPEQRMNPSEQAEMLLEDFARRAQAEFNAAYKRYRDFSNQSEKILAARLQRAQEEAGN